ncbi:GDSL-type esterase/lipase family protein [Paraclostridium bifermentans]|uniref:cytidylyltransferase domain-containing protein n=1 Tax=Paraclostridium bifermentans TaxID=1490 RepID=UPI001F15A968|nr:GDSL-type esterase/lipase family protein [Paraclostridium bifermentans]MCE9675727.1 GDSL-type esterase/lipase family protein [Paraclostridium bifermentans]MCR1876259.1 GDSL-type esterase/lipase family protein [Paraclostridium bifermentans]
MRKSQPLCIIPARSGSKGLKDKNMLFLSNKPLILHTIDAAIESGIFRNEDIYVSTDSEEYKEVIEQLRPIKVLLRKKELALDTSTTYEVLEDFLEKFLGDTEFILCQSTSPLRSGKTIKNAYEMFNNLGCDHLVSFSESDKSLSLFSRVDDNGCAKDIIGIDRGYTRQKQETYYYPNGAIYISKKNKYLKDKSFFTSNTFAYIMDKKESIDIDDKYDFINALGINYFNYKKREEENKLFYKNKYEEFSRQSLSNKIIIGDSRMEEIKLKGFSNISVGGITLHTVCENINYILENNIQEVLISIGVNDIRTDYNINSIENKFEELIDKLILRNIKVSISTIIYTVFRYDASNNMIDKLNGFIINLSKRKNIKLIDTNKIVSKNKQLKIEYTADGLHLNDRANELISEFFIKNLSI